MRRLAMLAALVPAACGGPPFRASEKDPERVAAADSTVLVVLDDGVKRALELVDHREQALADGRLRAELRLVNRTSRDLHVQASWSFKDERGFPIEPDSPFEHLFVGAGQTVPLSRESMAPGASAFHVQMKTARSAQE
jgi:hypothetical protein